MSMKVIRMNLSSGKSADKEVPRKDLVRFVGGRGLAAKMLYGEMRPGIDALAPENRLIFMTGPYTGTLGSFTAFYNVTTKSPLTGTILSAHSGGYWGPMLRRTGHDGIVIVGRSKRPAYILITEEGPELRDAADLWGKDALLTTRILAKRHKGSKASVIGPAGEKMVRFASIINDMHRAAGRGGAGAVMGSKNLKAIVVRGKAEIRVANKMALKRAFEAAKHRVLEKATAFSKYGTSMVIGITGTAGAIPTRNFQSAYFPAYEKIAGEKLIRDHVTKSMACYRCPLKCGKISRARGRYRAGTRGPEYETLATFGANLGNADLESIIMANNLCNKYGMDTISCADTIACAIELFERGVITKKDTDGLELKWGDDEAIIELVRFIGERRGFGKTLGEGSKRFAGKYGSEAQKYSMNVKGMEFPGYDPRGIKGMALAFATSTRGACHLRGPTYVPELFEGKYDRLSLRGKSVLLKEVEDLSAVYDSMIMCKFGARNALRNSWDEIVSLLNAASGHGYTIPGLKRVGERVLTVERMFNIREGFGKKDDTLPERLFSTPIPEGPSKGAVIDRKEFDTELDRYYRLRGWNENGVPSATTLRKLDLMA